ncbi:hypothetical protein AB0H88_37490 [Nonomuraea sp. NPDC050680]|uniref:hypothetical protein n=1 Tax=Nonomuraea sp. NPDC050680 TaxID=3154630 RepID=UPI0034111A5B
MVGIVALDQDREERADGVRVDRLAPAGREHVRAGASPLRATFSLSSACIFRWLLRTWAVCSSMLTMRFRPLFVVPSMRSPSMKAAEPVMVSCLPSPIGKDHS